MEIVFSVIAALLFVHIYRQDFQALQVSGSPWRTAPIMRFTAISGGVVLISLILVNLGLTEPLDKTPIMLFALSVILSSAIALVWLAYIKWIDIFEPERNFYLGITFILSCLSLILVFPMTDLINASGFSLNGDPLNDFLYSVVGIGFVEELVKVIPLLAMIKLSKQVNEPLDFVVYASVSALGFAFIENIMYIQNTSLHAFSARLLYSSVAHMFFSSIVGYALAINIIQKKNQFFIYLIIGLVIASVAHGFYDFWLINKAFYFPLITTLFYVGSLHVWVILKNNLINNTNFYRPDIILNKTRIKYRLITYLVIAIYLGYIFFALLNGAQKANSFLAQTAVSFLFLVVYISISFGSFNIVKGYTAPIRFPSKFFLPKIDGYPNYKGLDLRLKVRLNKLQTHDYAGKLTQRLVIEKDYNWYLFESFDLKFQLLIKPEEYRTAFSTESSKKVLVCFYSDEITPFNLHLDKAKVSRPNKALATLIH